MGFDCIIPLGQSCNVTFLLQNCKLKKETTLFEWFVSNNMNIITKILGKIGNNIDVALTQNGGHVYIENSGCQSGHYSLPSFREIYKRRRARLVATIRAQKQILFIRFERYTDNIYTSEDFDDFFDSIRSINPNTGDMKLLLFYPEKLEVNHPQVVTKVCAGDIIHSDPYCEGSVINTIFIDALREVGVNFLDTSDKIFTDASVV